MRADPMVSVGGVGPYVRKRYPGPVFRTLMLADITTDLDIPLHDVNSLHDGNALVQDSDGYIFWGYNSGAAVANDVPNACIWGATLYDSDGVALDGTSGHRNYDIDLVVDVGGVLTTGIVCAAGWSIDTNLTDNDEYHAVGVEGSSSGNNRGCCYTFRGTHNQDSGNTEYASNLWCEWQNGVNANAAASPHGHASTGAVIRQTATGAPVDTAALAAEYNTLQSPHILFLAFSRIALLGAPGQAAIRVQYRFTPVSHRTRAGLRS